jgi:adenine nucleotide transporter 17
MDTCKPPPRRVYYYFYERSRGVIINSRLGGKALSTMESILAGLIAGNDPSRYTVILHFARLNFGHLGGATTIISNPIWVVQTSQVVRTLDVFPADPSHPKVVVKKLGFIETMQNILAKDGVGALWRGIGPALVLVINPVLQYTFFEQLKNTIIKRRTARLRATGLPTAVAVLSDWDFFFLGALSKLGMKTICYGTILSLADFDR